MRFAWDTEMLELFWHFIAERQLAFYNRSLDRDPPWCEDPTVQSNHFTNVYRELDPGTIWLVDNVLSNKNLTPSDRAFLAMAYRLFGTEDVFEELGVHEAVTGHGMLPDTFREKWLARSLQAMMDNGKQAFTSAYMVSNYGIRKPKSEVIAEVLGNAAIDWTYVWDKIEKSMDRQQVWAALTSVYGVGRFVAFQTMVDLCYPIPLLKGDQILHFSNNEWVAAGPGALKGLSILAPKTKWIGSRDNNAIAQLVKMQYVTLSQRGMRWLKDVKGKDILIDRSNMQNCLCEFSKYVRLRNAPRAGGRKRSFDANSSRASDKRKIRVRKIGLVLPAIQTEIDEFSNDR